MEQKSKGITYTLLIITGQMFLSPYQLWERILRQILSIHAPGPQGVQLYSCTSPLQRVVSRLSAVLAMVWQQLGAPGK